MSLYPGLLPRQNPDSLPPGVYMGLENAPGRKAAVASPNRILITHPQCFSSFLLSLNVFLLVCLFLVLYLPFLVILNGNIAVISSIPLEVKVPKLSELNTNESIAPEARRTTGHLGFIQVTIEFFI